MKQVKILFNDRELTVFGDFQPEEKQTFDPRSGIGNPGCDAEFFTMSIVHEGLDVTHEYLGCFDQIDDLCRIEAMETDQSTQGANNGF